MVYKIMVLTDLFLFRTLFIFNEFALAYAEGLQSITWMIIIYIGKEGYEQPYEETADTYAYDNIEYNN